MAESEPTPERLASPRGTPLTALSWADVRTRVDEAGDFLLANPFVRDGEFYDPADTALDDPRHVYAVEPAQVFAFGKENGFSPTRWRF